MKNFRKVDALLLAVMAISLTSCYFEEGSHGRVEGSGPIITRTLELSDLEGLIVQNSADVILTKGSQQKITVEGQENIIRNLDTEVSGGVWKIRNRKPVWRMHKLVIRITLPEFNLIKISGSGQVESETPFDNLDHLELRITGSGDIRLEVEADDVLGRIGGSGTIRLYGKAKRVDFGISGSGDIFAADLKAKDGYARITGSGSIRTFVTDDLEARISGSGDIIYEGRPRINTSITGSGNVHSRN